MARKTITNTSLVRDVMTANPVTVFPFDTLATVQQIFAKNPFHHLPVMNETKVVGIIGSSDLERSKYGRSFFRSDGSNTYNEALLQTMMVEGVMTKHFHSISPDATVKEAYEEFRRGTVRCLLVLKEGQLLGIITPLDLYQP